MDVYLKGRSRPSEDEEDSFSHSHPYYAFGVGLAHVDEQGRALDAWFPEPVLGDGFLVATALMLVTRASNGSNFWLLSPERLQSALDLIERNSNFSDPSYYTGVTSIKNILSMHRRERKLPFTRNGPVFHKLPRRRIVFAWIAEGDGTGRGPKTVPDAYLRLQLLSHRKVRPGEISLKGISKVLPTLAWTSEGPIRPEEFLEQHLQRSFRGTYLTVDAIEKFPPMTFYVVPDDVVISDNAHVRLGAYLGPGTVVETGGFVDVNAGVENAQTITEYVPPGTVVSGKVRRFPHKT